MDASASLSTSKEQVEPVPPCGIGWIGTANWYKIADWMNKNAGGKVGDHKAMAKWADIIVLATKITAAEAPIRLCDGACLRGRTVIDTPNPIADAPSRMVCYTLH